MILLRSLAFNIAMYGGVVLFSLWGTVIHYAAPARLNGVGRAWGRFCLRALATLCGIRLDVRGLENLPSGGPTLIAAQHQSALDILVWLSLLPHPVYVLKQELLKIPLFGPLLVPAGLIAVNRAGGATSLRAMVADCRVAIAAGHQIVIFPEGTRVAPGERAKIQPGIVALAKALNIPVTPATTDSGNRWPRRAFLKTPGQVMVKIHPPLSQHLPRAEILAVLAEVFYQPPAAGDERPQTP